MLNEYLHSRPVVDSDWPDAHQLWLVVGVQSFQIGHHCETLEECEWMKEQFNFAADAAIKGVSDG